MQTFQLERVCVCVCEHEGDERGQPHQNSAGIAQERPPPSHPLPSLEDILRMAHGLVKRRNTVRDTAGINS